MAYSAGDIILDDEYIAFASSSSSPFGYNHFAGTGSGVYGLGQSALSTVSAGQTITAAQWNSLFTAMDNLANHTNDTLSSTAAVATGNTIAIKAALATDLATLAASVAAGCPNATALTTSAALQTSTSSTRWAGSHVVEQSVTFADADTMRHYFNAGGKVRTVVTRTGNGGSSATAKDTSFDELISALGNVDFGAHSTQRSGTGEDSASVDTAVGFHDMGTAYTEVMKVLQDSGTYTSNYILIEAKLDAAVGTAVTLTIKTSLVDADAGDSEFTAGNTSGVDQYENFVGTTNVVLYTLSPNTDEGLGTALGISSSAEVTNTTT